MIHPIQPLERDAHGVVRFQANAIVRFLLDAGPFDLNDLARKGFSREDQEHFAQLIGYSLSGAGDLGYFSDDTLAVAAQMWELGRTETEARIAYVETLLTEVKTCLRVLVPLLFRIHPEDLADDA